MDIIVPLRIITGGTDGIGCLRHPLRGDGTAAKRHPYTIMNIAARIPGHSTGRITGAVIAGNGVCVEGHDQLAGKIPAGPMNRNLDFRSTVRPLIMSGRCAVEQFMHAKHRQNV